MHPIYLSKMGNTLLILKIKMKTYQQNIIRYTKGLILENKPVWIKEYELTTISKGSLEEEANRIKREADALQDLNKSHNVQDFKDEEQIGTKLYIVLEYIDGFTLQEFH